MKFLALSLAFLLSGSAFADFGGKWQGTGSVIFNNQEHACESATLQVLQTATEISLQGGTFRCGDMTMTYKPSETLTIQNGQLLWNGNAVGTIDGYALTATIHPPDGSIAYYGANLANDNALSFTHRGIGNAGGSFVIRGNFTRVQ